MTPSTVFSRRIALVSVVSLSAIACSPISAQSNMQDSAGMQQVEEEQVIEKKGVKIVKRGKYAWKSKDGAHEERVIIVDSEKGEPHQVKITRKVVDGKETINVEGGELVEDGKGNRAVVYIDAEGKKHEFKMTDTRRGNYMVFRGGEGSAKNLHVMRRVSRVPHVRDQEREVREPRAPRAPRAPHSRVMRIELEKANQEIARAKGELEEAIAEVDREMAAIEDKDSAEYEGLGIAKSAIESAMDSLKDQHFDEREIEIEIRKMDREILHHLEGAMKDVHVQREIIVELQDELQQEVKGARKDMRTMFIEIEEMGEGEDRTMRLKAVKEMEEAMGDMAEHRLEALKKAEEELRKSRIELEKQIAEQKSKDKKAENKGIQ